MDHSVHNKIVSFIWSIADDCLRDVYVRGKYRDVILPMFVLRRLDCLLETTKDAVMEEVKFQRDDAGFTDLDPEGLREASGFVFYNTSPWTLKKLVDTAANNRQILEANFKAYLDGFSDNVKEIVDKFKLRAQVSHLAEKDVLLEVLEKFTSSYINLTPNEVRDPDGRKLPPLTNLGMGYVFEELIRKFNEENNEEAGEHFTPREVIDLMTHILFEPVKDALPPVITVYDPACGSGGMLTEAQDFITDPEGLIRAKADVYLYGKEINDETYAICKSDMMIKGNNPANIRCGSTLATDEFSGLRFDFMLSNPPYGKSWAGDQKHILDGKTVLDRRFEVPLKDFRGKLETVSATPRSSDGQLLFLMEMVNKMKDLEKGPAGSRIASVHNGSSLFTGDAGGGESNIRRYIIENDYLEAIIQLPNNLFYNTGITTYIWVLSNKKAEQRRGKVQLIDASQMFRKLRKNLGAKNCEFSPEDIREITRLYLEMPQAEVSKIFDNSDFGYYKVTIERPSRKAAQFTPERIATLRFVPALREVMEWAYEKWGAEVYSRLADHRKAIEAHLEKEEINLSTRQSKALFDPATWTYQKALLEVAEALMAEVGQELFMDFNLFVGKVDAVLKASQVKLTAGERNQLFNAVSWYDEKAERVVKKVHKLSGKKLNELLAELGCMKEQLADYGFWPTGTKGEYVEYESESDLRDTENVPLKDDIHGYFLREVRPHVDEGWINIDQTKIGYEISFNKYFYQHKPLRSLEEVMRDILALEAETEGLLKKLVSFGGGQ
ncbi:MAG: class I SAM-dependent DNA methyltransferase [Syntrophotaleaceae bacterium]